MLALRQQLAKSSVKKYQAMQTAVCADGRARGMFQFYGANRTGRFSGRIIQLQNLPQNHMPDLEAARELVRLGDYIPDKYEFLELSKLYNSAIYINQTGQLLVFTEYAQTSLINVDSEGAAISHEVVNGSEALILEKEDRIIVIWADSEKYFVIEGYADKDEALAMARSVRRIVTAQ